MDIEFPVGRQAWDPSTQSIAFLAIVDGKNVRCRVSVEALEDHFGAVASSCEVAFNSNRSAIEIVAEKKILAGVMDKSGEVLLTSSDF